MTCQLFRRSIDGMSSDVRWLTAQEERVWRRWLTLNARLSATLHKELHDDAGLSMPDFEVLVHLTDSSAGPDPGYRSGPGPAVGAQPSLPPCDSHGAAAPGAASGVCRRRPRRLHCDHTAGPRRHLEQAAPGHVNTVRRLVFDALSPEEVNAFATIIEKALTQLDAEPESLP